MICVLNVKNRLFPPQMLCDVEKCVCWFDSVLIFAPISGGYQMPLVRLCICVTGMPCLKS